MAANRGVRIRRLAFVVTAILVAYPLTFTAAGAQTAPCTSETYDGFESPPILRTSGGSLAPPLTLNGSAAIVDPVLRVTPSETNRAGSAFTSAKVDLAGDGSFSTYFRFQFTQQFGGGADGLVFVVQNVDNTAGGSGGGIGYSGLPTSIGVEFDNYNNGAGDGFSNSHVGIDVNGSTASDPLSVVSPDLDDGQIRQTWVDYNGATDTLEVRFALDALPRPTSPLLSKSLNLPDILGGAGPDASDAYIGFTSGTGSAGANHDVLFWQLNNCFEEIGVDPGDPNNDFNHSHLVPTAQLGSNPNCHPGVSSMTAPAGTSIPLTGCLHRSNHAPVASKFVRWFISPGGPTFLAAVPEGATDASGQADASVGSSALDEGDTTAVSFCQAPSPTGSCEGNTVSSIDILWGPPVTDPGPGPQPQPQPEGDQLCDRSRSGADGNEILVGTSDANTICGFGGDDSMRGLDGNDSLKGNAGEDIARGGEGNDRCRAEFRRRCET